MIRTIVQKVLVSALLLTLVAVFAPSVFPQSKKDIQRAEQLIKDGERAMGQKNYQAAASQFAQALGILPNNALAHYHKALAHYFLGEYEASITEFELALKNGQKPMDVYKHRWAAYEKSKRYDEALGDVAKVLTAEPSNSEFILAAAEINFNKGNYQEAASAYEKAVLKTQNNADLYYRLAVAKSRMGDIAGQAGAAEEAIKRNTQFLSDSLVLLGNARYSQKRIPEAIDAYSRALSSRADQLEAYKQLADLYRAENRIPEAIDTMRAALRNFPNNGEIYTELTMLYSLAGRKDDAVAAGRSATQLLPRSYAGFTNLCRAYNDLPDKTDLAISACNSALRLAPENGETLFYLGRAYDAKKDRAEAEKYYRRAVAGLQETTKNNPESSDAYYMLGNAYAEVGQNPKAIEAYKKCLELNPKFSKANFNIGIIHIVGGNKVGAMEQYNILLGADKPLAEKLKAQIDKL